MSELSPDLQSKLAAVVGWYGQGGGLAFAYAQGSLVEGLATNADLDVVVAWAESTPDPVRRLPLELADDRPAPEAFDQANFNLDRFFVRGQQFDVKHSTVAEVDGWWSKVQSGAGISGYPMPAVALHGFTTGDLVFDADGAGRQRIERYATVPSSFTQAVCGELHDALANYDSELERCVGRGDGLLFHELLVQVVRMLFITWFARQGLWWPHEKRLEERLHRLGRGDLAVLEQAVWVGDLRAQLAALRTLAPAIDTPEREVSPAS